MSSKHVFIVIPGLLMLLLIMLISGYIGGGKPSNETEASEKTEVASEWKTDKADPDLVKVVNFLINNKGKEIELAREKHKITGKEEIAVIVKVPGCCQTMFNQGVEAVSTFGKIESSSFSSASVHAIIPAEKIPEMEDSSLILGVNFEPKAKDYWMEVLK